MRKPAYRTQNEYGHNLSPWSSWLYKQTVNLLSPTTVWLKGKNSHGELEMLLKKCKYHNC